MKTIAACMVSLALIACSGDNDNATANANPAQAATVDADQPGPAPVNAAAVQPTEQQNADTVMHTTIREITADFATNGLVAADKYKDKVVIVTARIGSLNAAFGTISTFLSDGSSMAIAGFDPDPKYEPELKALKSGQKLTLACSVSFGGTLAFCVIDKQEKQLSHHRSAA